jgi:cytochrome c biogenesis protein CcmG, thiol:disulfide interchange protein DsbE
MEDWQRALFAFALEHGSVLFPSLALVLLALAGFLVKYRGAFRRGRWADTAVCLLLIVPCAFAFHFTRTVNAALIRRAGDFSFRLVSDGSPRRLSDFAGRVVVLNFWATWCEPCMKEMPDLERLAELRRGEVVVLTVSDETVEELRAALPGNTARLNGYFSDVAPDDSIGKMAYQGRPTTLIIGRDGRVQVILVGAHTLESFEAAVRKVL